MFETFSGSIIELITYLLPGFLCAWVFFGLTSHPKPSQFERVIQALIYTFIIRGIIIPVEWTLKYIGNIGFSVGTWDAEAETFISLLVALVLGVTFAYIVNVDILHSLFRKFKLTTRTSHPSEWFYVFSEKVTFIILNLKDCRRLYCWPKEWPIEPDKGQFYMMLPAWIVENEEQKDLPELDGVLVRAEDVQWVEFLALQENDYD